MRFDTKIAIVVREDLLDWQKLNVTAFLASGLAAGAPETIGQPYLDLDGRAYRAIFGQPVTVLTGDRTALRACFDQALRRELTLAVYTDDMFATGHDAANRETVAARATADLPLAGYGIHGPRNAVDRALKGLRLHG
jgi:hypothetical protein